MATPAEFEVPETGHSAPGGAAAAMELIAELEERLEKAQADKERLQRDVDELCKQQVGQGLLGVAFGSSEAVARIHARRVTGLEDQIRGWKAQNQELTKQAAEMQAEIRELHRTKTLAQQALRDADERARLARADVAHFQNQVAAALGQRDEALLDADQAKERCEKALSECESARERCEKAVQERYRLGAELAELKAEVGRFLHEGVESGALRSPLEASGQDAAEGVCHECGKGMSRGEENAKFESDDEAVSEEDQDTTSEGSLDEEPENGGRSGEEASEPEEASDGGFDVQKGPRGEGFDVEDSEVERRAMHERVESLEEQLRLVTEERESLKRALEASERGEIVGRSLRAADGIVAEIKPIEGVVGRKDVGTQIGTAADAPGSERTEAELRELSSTALSKETHTEAESELERGEREPVRAESLPRVNVLDADALGAGLLGASSALQAQLSQLLNEPGVASVLEETADRAIASQEPPESATSSVENRILDLSLSSTHPSKAPRQDRVVELDTSANLGANASVNPHEPSESTSDNPPNPSNSRSDKPPDSSNSRPKGLANSDGLSAIPGEEFDVRRALAQAAQEKVAALVLLSQQEERHEMEARQTLNLHARLGEAQERLADVVKEKVAALLEVAQLREEVENLKDSERRLSALIQQQQGVSSLSSRLLPAVWSKPPAAKDGAKEISFQGGSARSPAVSPSPSAVSLEEQERTGPTSPSWFSAKPASAPTSRRHSGNGSGTGTGIGTETPQKKPNWYRGWIPRGDVSKRPAKSDGWSSGDEGGGDVARLRVECAALQERVATVDRLTASVHKLRTRLAGAVSGVPDNHSLSSSEGVSHVRTALETIEAVATEAGQLKIALGGSLPVSYSEEGGYSTSENEGGKTGTRDAVDTATAAGLEMAELIIATAEVQRGVLQKLLDNDFKARSPQSGGLLA